MPKVHNFADQFDPVELNNALAGFDFIASHTTSVKPVSPFRYPGGKSWLTPQIHDWLGFANVDHLIEPFAGGASVSLYALFEGLVDRITINEIDPSIYNFWYVVKRDPRELICLIEDYHLDEDVTRKEVGDLKKGAEFEIGNSKWAFLTLLRNRVARNGVMTSKSGVLNKGDFGLYSRWYPETMISRIKRIHEFGSAISVQCADGVKLIKFEKKTAFFIDPPYNGVGKLMYTHSEVDHGEIMRRSRKLGLNGLLTYDAHLFIAGLVRKNEMQFSRIAMMGGMNKKKIELIISNDLSWLSGGDNV